MTSKRGRADDAIDRRDLVRTALILTALFWCILLYPTNFDASMSEKLRLVLGARPAGMPYDLYILLFTLQIALPMLVFFYHLLITRTYAREQQGADAQAGGAGGLISYLRYLLVDAGEGTAVRRSKLITFAGIVYMVGIVAWWIWFTDKHGI